MLFSQHTYTPHINTQFKKSCTELYSPLYRTLFSSSQYKTIIMINLSSPHITHKHQHFTTEIEENLRRSLNPRLRPKIIPPKKVSHNPVKHHFFLAIYSEKMKPALTFLVWCLARKVLIAYVTTEIGIIEKPKIVRNRNRQSTRQKTIIRTRLVSYITRKPHTYI